MVAFVIAQLLVVAPAGAAIAKLPNFTNPPKFKSDRIVEGISVGGVKVGMRKSDAIAVWGKPDGRCRRVAPYDPNDRRRGCTYGGQSGMPFAGFTFLPTGRVTSVYLVLIKWPSGDPGLRRRYRMVAPKVRPFKTAKNIGLRSTMKAARDAYGISAPQNVPDYRAKDFLSSVIFRQGDACTVFYSFSSAPAFTYIDSISVNAAAFCPADPEPIAPPESQ